MQGEEARADPRPSNPRLGRAGNEVKSQPLLLAPEQGCEGQAEPCGGGLGFCRVLRVRRSCAECQWAKLRVWSGCGKWFLISNRMSGLWQDNCWLSLCGKGQKTAQCWRISSFPVLKFLCLYACGLNSWKIVYRCHTRTNALLI